MTETPSHGHALPADFEMPWQMTTVLKLKVLSWMFFLAHSTIGAGGMVQKMLEAYVDVDTILEVNGSFLEDNSTGDLHMGAFSPKGVKPNLNHMNLDVY